MKIESKKSLGLLMIVSFGFLFSGCELALKAAFVGAGKSATIEDTGFLNSYDGLAAATDADKKAYSNLPDFFYISPKINIKAYKKIIIADFSSRGTNPENLLGFGHNLYKTFRKDMADNIAESIEGSAFDKVIRISEKIDPKDIEAVKKLPADAVLTGNIKELLTIEGSRLGAGLTSVQIEYKLIDIKTGEEVIKAIHRSTADSDKVATPQVMALSELFNKARNSPQN